MKIRFTNLALALAIALGTTQFATAQRNCSTIEHDALLAAQHPDVRLKHAEIENQAIRYAQDLKGGRVEATTVTIPVVVHVVYNTAAQNVSDAQIQSQIAVLNEDFAKLNADAALTPAVYAGRAANTNIQFCLARTSPTGSASTGILRVSTTRTSFSTNDDMKRSTTGGSNPWDATRYLNIWVCNMGGGILGYAQFPGGPAATDGVVILTSAFGRTGFVSAPFNKGRTGTHEVGHWLNLRHIWGDATCGNDQVNDTPTQSGPNYGCPTFPRITCSNVTGDMSMNYMDYTDDACMYMFSNDQATRMNALFATGGARSGFPSSTACGTVVPPTICEVPAGLNTSAISTTSATFNWASVTGAASYAFEYKPASATIWQAVSTTATSATVTGLVANTAYNWRVSSVCGGTLGSSAFSTEVNFSSLAIPTTTYCTTGGNSTADEWLAFVGLGAINNTTGGQNTAGYVDYTALSAALVRNANASISYRVGFRAGYTSTEYYRVWIDYNQDGDFADAGELVVSRSSGSAATLSSTFKVPTTALTGRTRLRVSMKYGSLPTNCGAYTYGQTEDYSVVISANRESSIATSIAPSVAPNPASDALVLKATLPQESASAQIQLLTLKGQQLYNAESDAATLTEGFIVPVAQMPAGMYLLRISSSNGFTKTIKVQVAH
jgi:hypothetical protein